MGTTVSYNGSTIATINNTTKVLETGGKYLTGDITVTDESIGNVYQDENGYVILNNIGEVTPLEGLYSIDDIMNYNFTGDIETTAEYIQGGVFYESDITSFSAPNAKDGHSGGVTVWTFGKCTSLEYVYLPLSNSCLADCCFRGDTSLEEIIIPNTNYINAEAFRECSSLENIVLKVIKGIIYGNAFYGCSSLTTVDTFRPQLQRGSMFYGCTSLTTLILRYPFAVCPLGGAYFNGSPIDSGGTGATIYIPKALYDHLGDGTALDYKAATNWSTYDSYGTITWAKIEDSYYESHWGDGTARTSDNLIDLTKCVDGITMPDNTTVTAGTWLVTDFIEMPENINLYTNLSRKTATNTNTTVTIYWYDSSKNYLNKKSVDTTMAFGWDTIYGGLCPIVMNSDASYFRIVFHVDYSNIAYIGESGSCM